MWLGRAALRTRDVLLGTDTLPALLARGSAASGGRFTRYPVSSLSLLLGGEWIASIGFSVRIGSFSHLSP